MEKTNECFVIGCKDKHNIKTIINGVSSCEEHETLLFEFMNGLI